MIHVRWPSSASRRGSSWSRGYTLPELLITVAILGVLAIGLANFLNSQLYQSLRSEKFSRETDDASRLQHLIETEVAESDQITYDQTLPSPCGTGKSLFTLSVPSGYDSSTGLPTVYTTAYIQNSSGLSRCGKPPNADGSLDFSGTASVVVVSTNLTLDLNTSNSTARVIDYSLKGPGGNTIVTAKAYAQVSVIR